MFLTSAAPDAFYSSFNRSRGQDVLLPVSTDPARSVQALLVQRGIVAMCRRRIRHQYTDAKAGGPVMASRVYERSV
jgi:hypothetical protein